MTIRASFETPGIRPPWMSRRVFAGIQWSIGLVLDAQYELTRMGIKARMPGVGTPDALPYIGADRAIERGPTESAESYAARLSSAFDTWKGAGNPHKLLEQLRAYFLPSPPAIRVVSNAGVWHEINPTTGVVTRTKSSPNNWTWDAYATGSAPRWWRGWVIIDSSAGPWSQWFVGTSGKIIGQTGLTIGSTASREEVVSIQRIARKWKPAHVHGVHVILTFDPTLYLASSPVGSPMPTGAHDQYKNRSPLAAYWEGTKT